MLSTSGVTCEAMSAVSVILSVSASPKVKFPEIVAFPVTVRLPPTDKSFVVVTFPVSVDVPVTANVELSVVAPVTPNVLDNVVAPVTPKVVPTVAASSTVNVSIVAVPSKYKSLNSSELVPKSMSLSVTGTIAPSAMYNCCTGLLDTST